MSKEKTFKEEAASARKWAKGIRVYGIVMYLVAAAAVIAVVLMFADGHPLHASLTAVNTLVIAFWAWYARHVQAPRFEDIAQDLGEADSRYGYLPR